MVKPIGIVIATSWEASSLLPALGFKRRDKDLYEAQVNGRTVFLCISGVGMEAARKAAYRLCSLGAGELISTGFCGAVVPELHVGDIITHRIATSATPVRTVQERQAITARANAVAVDMETQAVIEAGTLRGVPIRVCRVVSDRMEDDLTGLFGSDTDFVPWRIGVRLLNPSVWPLANRLRKNSQIAKKSLTVGLRQILAS